jgi:NAD(P)-dependent dehydrogenase (short-subunit alcohol dehydrogenase family)
MEVRAVLEERVAVVTGGNSGIGRAAALALAQAGAKVVVAARREPEGAAAVSEIETAGGEALFVRTDVAKEADTERMVETALRTYGRLDIAFNSAGADTMGGVSKSTAVSELEEADWDRIVDVNLKGVWLSMKYELRAMLEAGSGGDRQYVLYSRPGRRAQLGRLHREQARRRGSHQGRRARGRG